MFAKGIKKGTVRFTIRPSAKAKQAFLAGSFNQWKPVTMLKQKDGSFAVTVPVSAGVHQYKFVVDGQWIVDPDHKLCAPNPYGTANSIVKVD